MTMFPTYGDSWSAGNYREVKLTGKIKEMEEMAAFDSLFPED